MPRSMLLAACLLSTAASAHAQSSLPPLPDSTGWGVHVLAAAQDSSGTIWVGTYGQGIFRLPRGAAHWERIRSDTTATAISWDFVNALAFGPKGEIWYGTVGNGWGLSKDGGHTWRNWTLSQLGPQWQYVAPNGIVTHRKTTAIGTADGIQVTEDDGDHWLAIGDSTGPAARGPADSAFPLLRNEYVQALVATRDGLAARTLRGVETFEPQYTGWARARLVATVPELVVPALPALGLVGTQCGLQPAKAVKSCTPASASAAAAPRPPSTTWFGRPIEEANNSYIDQTYRYGSTMGGNFQQHQGVEFNNPDGTPVRAIGAGEVVYAGRAEAGALTVAIKHDVTVTNAAGQKLRIFSVYYHNSLLQVRVGAKVKRGDVIALVGNSGRATNDHLHLEVHASPTDSVSAIVDSLQRYPAYTTNPELWIAPLRGTGIVAGTVTDASGAPVRQARIYGLTKPRPAETPLSYVETYGERAHAHPLYGEHFAIGDVPAGAYTIGVTIDGKKVLRRIEVRPGNVTWVELSGR